MGAIDCGTEPQHRNTVRIRIVVCRCRRKGSKPCEFANARVVQIWSRTLAALALAGATAVAQVEGPRESGEADSMDGRGWSSLHPGLRPVSVIDRSETKLSGARNVWDLIAGQVPYNSFGLHRPYVIGSRRTAVLINGRPITDFNIDLDAVHVSAIDRIEILADSDVAIRGPGAAAGVVNIVFRNGLEGVEVVAGGEVPAGAGGDTGHASVLWGGPAGAGHLTIGVDAFQRREIRSAERDYGRST